MKHTTCSIALLLLLTIGYSSYAQRAAVRYLDAQAVVNMAKANDKPYTWLTIYVPKCVNASGLFNDRASLYHRYKDKVQLIMLSILASNDNADSVGKFGNAYGFVTPLYTMDPLYTDGNIRDTPERFMKDLSEKLGEPYERFQHIVIDKRGKMVYRTDDNITAKELEKALR